MKNVLMVCMGNICRSPMARVIAQKIAFDAGLSPQLKFDSAGTHAAHSGEKMDPRAQAVLLRHGYQAGKVRSRRIAKQDFEAFDLILAMDSSNLAHLQSDCPPEHRHKIKLFLADVPDLGQQDVPDPYYGNAQGFERVLELCELGSRQLLSQLQ